MSTVDLQRMRICDIGAGTGRFVNIALAAGASHVVALEPSDAFEILRANTVAYADRITYLRMPGESLPENLNLDVVLSIGVLHHVADPLSVLRAAFRALKPGGRIAIWVYGRENNAVLLALLAALRTFTRSLPHRLLAFIVRLIDVPLAVYVQACRLLPLPLGRYMRHVLGRMSRDKRRLVIYDQLNPTIARYYRGREVEAMLKEAGFAAVRLYHRHGYSWAATAARR